MKKKETAKKGLYVGVGVGLLLFVLVGLLPGSLLGGLVGLKIVEVVFGGPMTHAVLPRIILALSMIAGILFAGVVYIFGSGLIGWCAGHMLESSREKAAVRDMAVRQASS